MFNPVYFKISFSALVLSGRCLEGYLACKICAIYLKGAVPEQVGEKKTEGGGTD